MEIQGSLVLVVPRGITGLPVLKGRPDPLVREVLPAPLVLPVRKVLRVTVDSDLRILTVGRVVLQDFLLFVLLGLHSLCIFNKITFLSIRFTEKKIYTVV